MTIISLIWRYLWTVLSSVNLPTMKLDVSIIGTPNQSTNIKKTLVDIKQFTSLRDLNLVYVKNQQYQLGIDLTCLSSLTKQSWTLFTSGDRQFFSSSSYSSMSIVDVSSSCILYEVKLFMLSSEFYTKNIYK